FALDSERVRPRARRRSRMACREASSRTRGRPRTLATARVVRSSVVGPRPPVQTRTRCWAERRTKVAPIRCSSSSTVAISTTSCPSSSRRSASHWELVSTSSPRVISVPMLTMAQVIVQERTFSHPRRLPVYPPRGAPLPARVAGLDAGARARRGNAAEVLFRSSGLPGTGSLRVRRGPQRAGRRHRSGDRRALSRGGVARQGRGRAGVPMPAPRARQGRGHQGPAAGLRERRGGRGAPRGGGQGGVGGGEPAHRRDRRLRQVAGWLGVLRDGVPRGVLFGGVARLGGS